MRGIMESRGVGILLLLWVSSSAVSGVQTQPVGALQARIDAADPGSTLTIPAGIWPGAITLRHPLTLEAEPGAVIDGRGAGHVVRIEAPGVTLRGFEIQNSGRSFQGDHAAIHVTGHRARIEGNRIRDSLHGIYLKQVKKCQVRGNDIVGIAPPPNLSDPASALGDAGSELCDVTPPAPGGPGNGIHLWNSSDCLIDANTITQARDGIYFSFADHSIVRGNTIRHVRYGLHYMYSDGNVFEDNLFAESASGAAVMFSKQIQMRGNTFHANRGSRACGLLLQSVDDSTIESNTFRGNALALSFNQCYLNRVTANRIAGNYIGIRLSANSESNRFSMNALRRNLHPVEALGDTRANAFTTAGVGNHWEEASLVDFDGDGIGDLPHRDLDVTGSLRREFPAIALLSDSPALRFLRWAIQRAAVPGSGIIEDAAPLAPRRLPPVLAAAPVHPQP